MSNSVYLSSQNPRWSPETEEDLQNGIDEGLLEESHYIDVKRELESSKSANRELARDLASFAIDGGTLLVGISEDKTTGKLSLAPQPLKGLSEKVEQVARTIPDDPLAVITTVISSSEDGSKGYLLVHIPPSSQAPHMVDSKYLGRGDKTKHFLSNADVSRLHQLNQATQVDILKFLDKEIERDPRLSSTMSHLFLVAEPIPGKLRMLVDVVSSQGTMSQFRDLALTPELKHLLKPNIVYPSLDSANDYARRSQGAALTTHALTSARQLRDEASAYVKNILELEVYENGGIRILMDRFSDFRGNGGKTEQLFDTQIVIYARQIIELAKGASEHSGYLGSWAFGVGATNLQGKTSWLVEPFHIDEYSSVHEESTYKESTTASYAELLKQPALITERLVGRFLRTLDVYSAHESLLKDTE